MYPCTHTQTHAHTGFGADEGGKKLNTHGLFCSLSCCLSFFLHPLWRWWCCWCWHWLCVCLYVCLFVVCAWKRFPACACLIIFVTSSVVWSCVCVCVCVRACVCARVRASAFLWFASLLCAPVCVCVHLYACLCLALWLPLPGQYFYFQEVLPVLAAKHCIMQANAELHQSALAKHKKNYGEEIARLQVLWLPSLPAIHFHY